MNYTLVAALSEVQIADVRALFEEYRVSLDIDLCFQQYEAELASLPGKYAFPAGRLYVLYAPEIADGRVKDGVNVAAGCIALRPLEIADFAEKKPRVSERLCEMKRLYVRPAFRGRGFSRLLAQKVLADGRAAGYSRMYLDTLDTMTAAIGLYESLGFELCASYYDNPDSRAVYMKKNLI